jgi:Type II secretion system (T2SS), protein M subtype b
MSEQAASPRGQKRERIRATIQNFNSSRGQRILGLAEVIGIAGSLVILLLVTASYFYLLLPARLWLNTIEAERAGAETRLRASQVAFTQEQSTAARVQEITDSLDYFENRKLVGASVGRMGLYDDLNLLMRQNGLRNTSGPTYTPLEPAGSKSGTSGTRSGSTKWQSIYPGIAISVTVEGQYQNLRRFIQDIETSKQFVIINSVELEQSTEGNNSASIEGESSNGQGNALVSLRLEMATYFQRASPESAGTDPVAH